jgi:hypothetical protein
MLLTRDFSAALPFETAFMELEQVYDDIDHQARETSYELIKKVNGS